MFHSKWSNYNIVDATPFKRDVVKELADECHKQGIDIHFYYSHIDGFYEQAAGLRHQALPLAGVGDDVVLHLHAHHRRAVGRKGRVVVRRLGERGVAQPARVGVHDGMVLPRDVRAAVVDEVAVRVRVPRLERELRRVLPSGQRAVRDEDVVRDCDTPASVFLSCRLPSGIRFFCKILKFTRVLNANTIRSQKTIFVNSFRHMQQILLTKWSIDDRLKKKVY